MGIQAKISNFFDCHRRDKNAPRDGSSPISETSSFELDKLTCAARDEASGLRNEVCKLRMRLEEMQDEHNYIFVKANELESVIQSFRKDHVHDELVKKALMLAEISMVVDSLRTQVQHLRDEKDQLLIARTLDKNKMEQFSEVVRSFHCSDTVNMNLLDDNAVFTPQKVVKLTLMNTNSQIEFLEDEHHILAVRCKDQQKEIARLDRENGMKDVKIDMLEELFRALNDRRQHEKEAKKSQMSLPEHQNASSYRKERLSRPNWKKSNSWAGLLDNERRSDGSRSWQDG